MEISEEYLRVYTHKNVARRLLLLIFKQKQPNKQANLLRISYNLLHSFICAAGTMRFCHGARAKQLNKKRKNVI